MFRFGRMLKFLPYFKFQHLVTLTSGQLPSYGKKGFKFWSQVLFVVIFAVIMIIIYGGIQPDGLVLSKHKVLINTTALNSKRSRNQTSATSTTTGRPLTQAKQVTHFPGMRGRFLPVDKWGPHDFDRDKSGKGKKKSSNDVPGTFEEFGLIVCRQLAKTMALVIAYLGRLKSLIS